MTTLFITEDRSPAPKTSGRGIVLYALAGAVWLGLAIGNFRDSRHFDRAWMQVIIATLTFFTTAMHLSRWRKQRRSC